MPLLLLSLLAVAAESQAGLPLTLEAALAEARQANARLPVAAFEVKANEEQVRSARGQLLPRLGIQSELQVAPHGFGYAGPDASTGAERLPLVAMENLYAGPNAPVAAPPRPCRAIARPKRRWSRSTSSATRRDAAMRSESAERVAQRAAVIRRESTRSVL